MSLFNYTDDEALGTVLAVDTETVLVRIDDPVRLRGLQVNRLVVLQSRPGQFLIGMVRKITRQADEVDPDEGGSQEEVSAEDLIRLVLIGTLLNRGRENYVFRRGIETVPEIDAFCFALERERLTGFMRVVSDVGSNVRKPLILGHYALDTNADTYLNGDRFFQRHAVIVGSTGSGKSWTTARVLEQVADLPNANALVFDIHGEYRTMAGEGFRHLRVAGPGDLQSGSSDPDVLFLPYWLLDYDSLRSLLIDRSDQNAPNQAMLIGRLVREGKERFLTNNARDDLKKSFTVDSPIPFDIAGLISNLNDLNVEMVPGAKSGGRQGDFNNKLSRMIARLEAKIEDRRLGFLFKAPPETLEIGYLDMLVNRLLAGRLNQADRRGGVKIIDFSEVPSDILPLIVSMVAGIVFSVQQWTRSEHRHPIALFCDEAHNYIPDLATEDSEARVAVRQFEKIAKEGRKYGIGLVVISQRPAEVSRTVISQCNNVIAMRLTNADDQARVRSLLPETLTGFTDMLPVLDTGEAIVVGDASLLPSRVRIAEPRNKPDSRTIPFWWRWSQTDPGTDLSDAVAAWRRQSYGT